MTHLYDHSYDHLYVVHISLLGSFVYYYKSTFVRHDSFERYNKQSFFTLCCALFTTALYAPCAIVDCSLQFSLILLLSLEVNKSLLFD